MSRPVAYACDPGELYCECGHCELPPTREINLDAIVEYHRAFNATFSFLLLLCALAAFMAIGLVNTEEVHRKIVAERTV